MGKNDHRRGAGGRRGNFSRNQRGGKHNQGSDGPKFKHNSNFRNKDKFQIGRTDYNERAEKWTNKVCLKEVDVGISEYVSKLAGFRGIIKSKYSDFQVNEIDLDGEIARITDLSPPERPKCDPVLEVDIEQVIKIISSEKYEDIKTISQNPNEKDKIVEIDVTPLEKSQRSLIHNTIREVFGNSIIGSTFDRDNKKYIKVAKFTKGSVRDKRTKWLWPHEHIHFLLYKENVDTIKAASMMAQHMPFKKQLAYAGTKDKRGITTQWVSQKRCEPETIIKAASRYNILKVGNFTFKPQPLKLGMLKGNRFRIALRKIETDECEIEKSLTHLKEHGFINYYGLQRFGTTAEIPTYEVGKALLKMQFKEACELILKPRPDEDSFMKRIREYWWKTKDASGAVDMFYHTNTSIEKQLLQGLAKHSSNDFVNALENLPRNIRLLYIHSYQSLVWNEMVSQRIKKFGFELQVGDLVLLDNLPNSSVDNIDIDFDGGGTVIDNHIDGEDDNTIDEIITKEDALVIDSEPIHKVTVKPLIREDIASGKYSITDVILPLPGHDVKYPENECAQWYIDRLAKDDMTSDSLKMKQKTYSLSGAYRKILAKPDNLSWYFLKYNNESDMLIQTDLEKIKGTNVIKNIEDGQYKALVVDFCLPSSSYATMALRELSKDDTSTSNQIHIESSNKMETSASNQIHIESSNKIETSASNQIHIESSNKMETEGIE